MIRAAAWSVILALSLAACQGPTPTAPPPGTGAAAVLTWYLDAFKRGDCQTAREVWVTVTPTTGDGDLCRATTLSAYTFDQTTPATPSDTEQVFATTLTTTGTADLSVEAGQMIWFFDLKRQPDGTWLIAGGGSGP